jgi:hypothetical protein
LALGPYGLGRVVFEPRLDLLGVTDDAPLVDGVLGKVEVLRRQDALTQAALVVGVADDRALAVQPVIAAEQQRCALTPRTLAELLLTAIVLQQASTWSI